MDSKCRLAVLTLVCLIAMNDSETNDAGFMVRGEEKEPVPPEGGTECAQAINPDGPQPHIPLPP